MDDQARYDRAQKRVDELKDFYKHLITYLVVNAFLFVVNMLTSPDSLWFFWPLLGWGIGVAIHAVNVFGTGRFLGKDWEERKIKEILDKEGRAGR